jgi:hypothetical protein
MPNGLKDTPEIWTEEKEKIMIWTEEKEKIMTAYSSYF